MMRVWGVQKYHIYMAYFLTKFGKAKLASQGAHPVTLRILIWRGVVTGVDGNAHRFRVSLKCVVFGAPLCVISVNSTFLKPMLICLIVKCNY